MKTLGNYYLEKARKEETRTKKVKETIKDVMKGLEIKKIQTEIGSFTLRKNNPSLIIDDEKKIPAIYKEIIYTEKIKKDEIKKDIKTKEVEGCHLVQSESIIIK